MTETTLPTDTSAPVTAPPAQVWPTLRATNARGLIAFLVEVFGFIEVVTYGDQPDGSGEHVMHAQLAWPEGGGIMLGSARTADDGHPADPWELSPGSFGAYVVTADPVAVHARAVAAGATITEGVHETDYGSTDFAARDPEGNRWSFGTYAGEPVPRSG
jgi:uncharacterized glyoxalase superfamily protein PhnB